MRDGQSQVCEQSHLDRRSLGRRSNHPEGASECPELAHCIARHERASATASVVTEIIGPTIKVERGGIADRLKGVTSFGQRALTRNGTG